MSISPVKRTNKRINGPATLDDFEKLLEKSSQRIEQLIKVGNTKLREQIGKMEDSVNGLSTRLLVVERGL